MSFFGYYPKDESFGILVCGIFLYIDREWIYQHDMWIYRFLMDLCALRIECCFFHKNMYNNICFTNGELVYEYNKKESVWIL